MSEICILCIVRLADAPPLDRRRFPHLIEIPVTIQIIDDGPAEPSEDYEPIEVDREGFWSASPTDGIAIGLPASLSHAPYSPGNRAIRDLEGNGSRAGINDGIDHGPANGAPPAQLAQAEGEPPGEERPGSQGEPLTYNEQLRVGEYYNAYRQLQAIDPNNPALGPFLQTPNWIPSEADVASIQATLADAIERTYYSAPTGVYQQSLRGRSGTNQPASIGGRYYTGHALDKMQSQGITPSVVENVLAHGIEVPSSDPSTIRKYDPLNNVTVVFNHNQGVVTAFRGGGRSVGR